MSINFQSQPNLNNRTEPDSSGLTRDSHNGRNQLEEFNLPQQIGMLEVARAVNYRHSAELGNIQPIDETSAIKWMERECAWTLGSLEEFERRSGGVEIAKEWYGDYRYSDQDGEPNSLIQVCLGEYFAKVHFRVSLINSQGMSSQYLREDELEKLLQRDSLKLVPLSDLVSQYCSLISEFRVENLKLFSPDSSERPKEKLSPLELVVLDADLMKQVSRLIEAEEIAASDTFEKLTPVVSILEGRLQEIVDSKDIATQKRMRAALADINSFVCRTEVDTSDMGYGGKLIARSLIKIAGAAIRRYGKNFSPLERRIEEIDSGSDLMKAARLFLVLSGVSGDFSWLNQDRVQNLVHGSQTSKK